MKRLPALCTVALSLTVGFPLHQAWGLDRPASSPKDKRIKYAVYDPEDIYPIDVAVGVASTIVLANDEKYVTHAFGDGEAYDFNHIGQYLLLKPKAENAAGNLTYITDKRLYTFVLRYHAKPTGKETQRLVMQYPEQDAQRLADARQKAALQAALAGKTNSTQYDIIHWTTYTMSGDTSLAPVNAWDDGAQTWLRFAPGQDLPTVYFVDTDGQEVIPNRHMADANTIVLHRVNARWHLRLGDQVLAIHNSTPQPRNLDTGTISPSVQRVLRIQGDHGDGRTSGNSLPRHGGPEQ